MGRRAKWNDELIISTIKKLHSQGVSLNYKNIKTNHSGLHAAARQHFGTWGYAVESAGFEYSGVKEKSKWSKETIIDKIKEYESKGVSLKSGNIQRINNSLFSNSCYHFGSWGEAVTTAGFDYKGNVPNQVIVEDDTKKVIITKRDGTQVVVLVDSTMEFPTNILMDNRGYPIIKVNNKNISLHRYVYGDITEGAHIDHIDRNPFNCRLNNLREATPKQNMHNKLAKGYSYRKQNNKWQSYISINEKKVHLGYFDTEIEASIVYKQACIKHRGEYAPTEYYEELPIQIAELNKLQTSKLVN